MGQNFNIFGQNLAFEDKEFLAFEIKSHFRSLGKKYSQAFYEQYKQWNSAENVVKKGEDTVFSYAEEVAGEAVKIFLNLDIYSISKTVLLNEHMDLSNFYEASDRFNQALRSISRSTAEAARYRESRKNSRGRLVGGGFGLGGAAKGIATAGAVNMATGILHSSVNVFGNIMSSIDEGDKVNNLYADFRYAFDFTKAISLDFDLFGLKVIELINRSTNLNLRVALTEDQLNTYTSYFENIELISEKEKRTQIAIKLIHMNPEDFTMYKKLISLFGDKNGELTRLANVFGIPLESCIESYVKETIEGFKSNKEADIIEYEATVTRTLSDFQLNDSFKIEMRKIAAGIIEELRCEDYTYVLRKHYQNLEIDQSMTINNAITVILQKYTPELLKQLATTTLNKSMYNKYLKKFSSSITDNEYPLLLISDKFQFNITLVTTQNIYCKDKNSSFFGIKNNQISQIDLFAVRSGDFKINDKDFYFDMIPEVLSKDVQLLINDILGTIRFGNLPIEHHQSQEVILGQIPPKGPTKATSEKDYKKMIFDFLQAHDFTGLFSNADLSNPKVAKRFKNAYEKYAYVTPNEEALLLYDTTIMGSGKTGFVLTNTRIHIKTAYQKPICIELSNINFVNVKKDSIFVNGEEISMIGRKDVISSFVDILSNFK
ncbi:hypothetical protein [Sporosarcina sp. FSL K6-5500]|uniref:hypothetical protein n=1 Tax=Sporosarcina sp. FSL K6-5500 TaxID=2921558 RepID=UPI0030F9686A